MNKQTMAWLKRVVDGIDEKTTHSECLKILDQRGRACTPPQLIAIAKEIYNRTKDMRQFLVEFGAAFEFLHIKDDAVTVIYPRCFCHHLASVSLVEVPNVYCECSRSWLRELFEGATGKTVEVDVLESVIRGGQCCRFSLRFS